MLTHVVLFKLLPGVSPAGEAAQAMHAALQKLPGYIEEICDWQCGFNTTPDALAWDYMLLATFQTRRDLDAYLDHPAHQDVVALIEGVAEIRFCDLE